MRTGTWLNPEGFECTPQIGTLHPVIWDVRLKRPALTWQYTDGAGEQWQFRRKTTSDFLSIPWPMTLFVSRDSCTRTALMHDDGYRHASLWVSRDNGVTWQLEPMTRKELDDFMHPSTRAEKLSRFWARAVHIGIRAGGWVNWNKYRRPKPKTRNAAGWLGDFTAWWREWWHR